MKNRFLIVVLFLGFLLRTVALGKFPLGFTPDEASFGYDTYSILKTGKDQWGHPIPLVLESFGDYKSPLYAYLAIPSVVFLGLTKFAVRLPNALVGTAAIIAVYLLAGKLFGKRTALFASFLLAISPWHVMLSRGAFEANLTTLLLPLGVYFYLQEKYSFSALFYGLNLFSYHSAKIVTPMVILLALLFFRKKITKKFLVGTAIFAVFASGALVTFFQGGSSRAMERSITNGALEEAFSQRIKSSGLFHNKYQVTAKRFVGNYLTYLSPQFFFTQGPGEGTYGMIPGRGTLLLSSLPFLVLFLAKFKNKKEYWFVSLWLLASPIPASLATGVGYHANRAETMLPVLQVLLGVGAVELFRVFDKRKLLKASYLILIAGFFIFFLEDYFIQSPHKIGQAMLTGNIEYVQKEITQNPEGEIIIDKKISEPQIYVAFVEKTDPRVYQEASKNWRYKEIGVNWVDQIPEYRLGRFVFK